MKKISSVIYWIEIMVSTMSRSMGAAVFSQSCQKWRSDVKVWSYHWIGRGYVEESNEASERIVPHGVDSNDAPQPSADRN